MEKEKNRTSAAIKTADQEYGSVFHSIRTKITLMTVTVIMICLIAATVFGVIAIKNIGSSSANQMLLLLCEAGEKNLDSYFESVEQSVEMVSAYVESDLDGLDDARLQAHLDRVSDIFKKMTNRTNGILTYYYRIDPEVSTNAKGFWFVNLDGDSFVEHEVTDITKYDTSDTSHLVWFTVPKATGGSVWLPPYITENLDERVISYNVPVYYKDHFVGVIGIEIDYSTMAEQVNNITLYDNGYAFINDDEGTIIYHPHMDVEELLNNHPKVPSGLLSDDTFITYDFDGVEKQAVWLPLENGMRLNVTVPVSEINAGWHKWVNNIIMIFSVMLLSFVYLIMRFTGHFTKPLMDLTEVAEQVNEGNYDCEFDYDGNDEVGILTKAFKKLTDHLKIYISDLNDLAYADALTSVHNKGAFDIYINNMEIKLKEEEEKKFAIIMFDCNSLKEINDKYGHDKGDLYLKNTCMTICESFKHSPVFRIGGDEFVAILEDNDYRFRVKLLKSFDSICKEKIAKAKREWERPDVARGMAVYDPKEDESVNDVVHRADKLMYENKWKMKGHKEEI